MTKNLGLSPLVPNSSPLTRLETQITDMGFPEPVLRLIANAYGLLRPQGSTGIVAALAASLSLPQDEVVGILNKTYYYELIEVLKDAEGKTIGYRATGKLRSAITSHFIKRFATNGKTPTYNASYDPYPQLLAAAYFFRYSPAKYISWCADLPLFTNKPRLARTAFVTALAAARTSDSNIWEYEAAIALIFKTPALNMVKLS